MARRIEIDPITRLEGHGKIDLFLDDDGAVQDCIFSVPELRGFEKFAEGRPVEEMPRITSRICGVCPEAHMMASAKAGDAVYGVELTETAKKIRQLQYSAFFLGDHTTHFYALSGPDFIMGPDADPAIRNILGFVQQIGADNVKKVLRMRLEAHEVTKILGGKAIHGVNTLPGGVSKGVSPKEALRLQEIADYAMDFAKFTLKIFDDVILKNPAYVEMILSDPYQLKIHNMGMVDENNRVSFYEGKVRVCNIQGAEIARYSGIEYLDHIEEHVESYTFMKFPYLKKFGWQGLTEGDTSGVYRASPLSRLNVAEGMATPLAQENYERMYTPLMGRTIHSTLATHWARVIELVQAAEQLRELAYDPQILEPDFHTIPTQTPGEGVGIVEAPRGTLTHHYITDEEGIIKKVNLIVGTTNNHSAIAMSIKKAAQGVIKAGVPVTEALLNKVEMAFRAYDPCLACSTHSLPGQMALRVRIYDARRELQDVFQRD